MAYEKQIWENYPSTNSPITADALNHIENGIYNNSMIVQDSLSGSSTSNSPSIRAINEALSEIQLRGGGDTLPIGTIMPYTSDIIPNGWLLCDGSAFSASEYPELFDLIGVTHGWDENRNPLLPDMRGRVVVGKKAATSANDTEFNALGKTGGEKEHTLTIDEMPSHNHEVYLDDQGTGGKWGPLGTVQQTTEVFTTTNNVGNGQAHNNLQPYIVTNFIIKAKITIVTNGEVIQENDTATTENVYSATAINNKINEIKAYPLYDRTGVLCSNNNNSVGIKGGESFNVDMSGYKKIKVYGFMNARKYQFTLEIDLTDSLNEYESNNKYWGRTCLTDITLSSSDAFLFTSDCSVNQAKSIFKVENFGYRDLSNNSTLTLRNNNSDYVVTKIIGYKAV